MPLRGTAAAGGLTAPRPVATTEFQALWPVLRGGGVVMIAGPDGAGKTTLALELEHKVFAGGPVLLVHHSSGMGRLPRRLPRGPTTEPHRDKPYPSLISLGKTVYLYFDFLLGWYTTILPFVAAGGWVILQRDWWDLLVDPRRYRMQPIPRLGRLLGRLLPQPDLTIVLEADPDVILARKAELPAAELGRQASIWRQIMPPGPSSVYLDAAQSADEVLQRAATAIAQRLESGGGSRHGLGWVALPWGREPRWLVPRGPGRVSAAALGVYQPVTTRGRLGWEAARRIGRVGGFRLLPRGAAPPLAVREAVDRSTPRGGSVAVARTNHAGRWTALTLTAEGSPVAVVKVATDEAGKEALAREARNLERFAGLLPSPLCAPKVLGAAEGQLVLGAVDWLPQHRPWRLSSDVAFALGGFFRSASTPSASAPVGLAHRDVAPWNLLRTHNGWVLIDWEDARESQPPFYDLLHFLVQSHALLGRPRRQTLLDGLTQGAGWVGEVVLAYAKGAALPPRLVLACCEEYLRESMAGLDQRAADGRRGLRAREQLLRALSASQRAGL